MAQERRVVWYYKETLKYKSNSQYRKRTVGLVDQRKLKAKDSTQTILELLEKINQNLEALTERLDKVIELHGTSAQQLGPEKENVSYEGLPLDVATLLSLPDHLRKTALTICKLGQATAEKVASETGRVRAAESDCLNQLVTMGHLRKKRIGRDVYFYIEK